MLAIGRPIGTELPVSCCGAKVCTIQPTVASVGPYSLWIFTGFDAVFGKTRSKFLAVEVVRFSPPRINCWTRVLVNDWS